MGQDGSTSMALSGVSTAFSVNLTATGGNISVNSSTSSQTGYDIAQEETDDGLAYNVISLSGDPDVPDAPSVEVVVNYSQDERYSEVDLEVRYTDIPAGTSLAVECSETDFNISKQQIEGSSLVGSQGVNLGKFDTSIALKLWLPVGQDMPNTASLSLSMSSIEGGDGGPVKKTLLEKIIVNP